MQKQKIISISIIFALLGLLVIILSLFTFDSMRNRNKDDKISVNIYFMDEQSLKTETRTIENGINKEVLGSVLQELKQGPRNLKITNPLPENIKIKEAQINENKVTVDLSSEYNQLKAKEETYLRTSIVYTLTDLSFVDSVKITCEGKDIESSSGEFIGFITRDDINTGDIILPSSENQQIIKLYFVNADASGLVCEERQINVSSNVPIENYIIEQLIAGPTEQDLMPTIPPETNILGNIKTLDNVCYLDLSSEFVSKHSGGSLGELYTIFSIVNSLTELSTIKKVQFLIEGERLTEFKGHIDFSKPFERDEDLIKD